MKNFVCLVSILFVSFYCQSQVGVGTTTPAASSTLEVSSTLDGGTTRAGFMPPRVTTAQLADFGTLGAGDKGLMVYVSDANSGSGCLQIWDGTAWDCVGSGATTRTAIASQDFEATPATPELTYTVTGGGIRNTTDTAGYNPSSTVFPSGTQGYGTNDGATVATLDFASTDLSSFSSGVLELRLASFADGTQGADQADEVEIFISTDGGSTYSLEMVIRGINNARHDFTGTGSVSSVYDGDNIAEVFSYQAGGGLFTGAAALTTVTLTGIDNSATLVARIVMTNGNNEIWIIDDVTLYGQ